MKDEPLRLLLCEDDANLGFLLREYLQAKGNIVDLCGDGELGLTAFKEGNYDLCILDVMMPKKDGFGLAHDIKQINADMPIIFLTAKNMKEDILTGFRLGADDYLTKPFSMEELLFRIEAILRRVKGSKEKAASVYQLGKITFDTAHQMLSQEGFDDKRLTTKECELLTLLCIHLNEVLLRNHALMTIWGENTYFNARSMDVYITKLRKLLKDDPEVQIMNIHGRGYKLVTPNAE